MATLSNPVPQMPPTSVPLIDARTGLVRREWYEFLKALRDAFAIVQGEIP